MHRTVLTVAALLCAALLPGSVRAQEVIRHPDSAAPFVQRWAWGTERAETACPKGCWVGYGIRRIMESNAFIGWHTHLRQPTLQMLVYGREVEPPPTTSRAQRAAEPSGGPATERMLKEVAILFRFAPNGRAIRDLRLSSISLPVQLDGLPLVWLGPADQPESIRLLQNLYARETVAERMENLVSAVGMHDAADLVVPFLKQVLASDAPGEVREQAVFWLAETRHPDVLPLLERTARRDASGEIREQAVFGISRIETDAAEDLLIDLARHLDDRETRQQAVFWLGQKASNEAVAGLEDLAENDPDVEIRKKAVFAIAQLPEDEGIPRLIRIARTHRDARVRHEAIFWLGESGDPRAVDVLAEIVKGR